VRGKIVPSSTLNRYVLLLLSSAVLWSLGGVLVKSIDLAPVTIAGSRSLIATVIIAVTRHIVSWGLASKYFVVEEGIWSDCFVGYGQISCGS